MKVSEKGIELIKKHEGFKAVAYKCPAGIWTVGYGCTVDVTEGMKVTEIVATQMLKMHLMKVEKQLNDLKLPINQNQFDALASFIYNIGYGAFSSCTLLTTIRKNASDAAIAFEFNRWIRGGGKVLPGLVARRKDESKLYFS